MFQAHKRELGDHFDKQGSQLTKAIEGQKLHVTNLAGKQSEEYLRRTNNWYAQVRREGGLIVGDLNHLYHDLHAPLGKQIAKEIEVALEAQAAKGKYPMINEDSTNC